jgi:hypothetical protein
LLAVALSVPLVGWYLLWVRRTLSGFPRSSGRLTIADAHRQQAKAFGRPWLWALFLGDLLFLAGSAVVFTLPAGRLVGGLGLVLWGFGAFLFAAMLRASQKP